jgi:cobalt transporter subunit CbtA
MIQKMLTSALVAGCAAWLLAAVLHFAFVQEMILLGETYETGAAVHFAGLAPPEAGAFDGEDTAHAEAEGHSHDAADASQAHSHGDAAGEAASDLERNLWTVVFFGLVYVAYALILVAGFMLATVFGQTITAREGLLWGIAGFAAFQLAPAMGLAPELPGTMAADLGARQVWWWTTVAATGAGLGLIGYGRWLVVVVIGVGLIAAPHVIGAPLPDGFSGVAPPEVASAFSARVIGAALAVWAVMGWVAGQVWSRNPA